MPADVEARLARLGLTLPDAPSPAANYVPYTMAKGLIFIAGQAPVSDGKYQSVGKVGAEVTLESAQSAARLCGLRYHRTAHHDGHLGRGVAQLGSAHRSGR